MFFILLYIVVGAINIFAEHFSYPLIMYASKVLLMPLLGLFLFSKLNAIKEMRYIYFALFFSWLGDIFLMFPRKAYTPEVAKMLFILGLVSFLIAHINYIIYFIKEVKMYKKATLVVEKPYLVIPFLLYGVFFLYILYPTIGSMKLPITGYTIVIIFMALTAFNRKNLVNSYSFLLVFLGAILFVFSDSCIAINVFYAPFYSARFLIMLTYILAQFLIINGIINTKINS